MKITFNSTELMNRFIDAGLSKEQMTAVTMLYQAAADYESASGYIERYSEQLRESLEKIAKGETPFWAVVDRALLIEKYVAEQKEARTLFNAIAKVAGYEIE